jgi:hypothetical protein
LHGAGRLRARFKSQSRRLRRPIEGRGQERRRASPLDGVDGPASTASKPPDAPPCRTCRDHPWPRSPRAAAGAIGRRSFRIVRTSGHAAPHRAKGERLLWLACERRSRLWIMKWLLMTHKAIRVSWVSAETRSSERRKEGRP